jgi:BolA family transcriptional regulator, general stress-responsive regulator
MSQGMEDRIRQKLAQGLQPLVMEIVNDSSRHTGHAGDDGSGESHFHVKIVSSLFNGKGRVERQRMVYDLLKEEMAGPVHALSVKTIAADEYDRV